MKINSYPCCAWMKNDPHSSVDQFMIERMPVMSNNRFELAGY
jgi:hypothetical protein